MMRFGPADGPVVVVALPLFEEANRTRAVAAAMLRALAALGIAGALPELPGQGESLLPTEAMTLSELREAFAGAVGATAAEGRPVYAAGIRSGALVDASATVHGRWHLAPQDGPSLMRELARIEQHGTGGGHPGDGRDAPVLIAGNWIAPRFLAELSPAAPYDEPALAKRVVRLEGDRRPADNHVAGAPPWRRAEPGNEDALAQRLATDISDWIRTCVAR